MDDTNRLSQILDESRKLVAKANEATAIITDFDVDMDAMMADPEFQKMIEPYVVEHFPYAVPLLEPPF